MRIDRPHWGSRGYTVSRLLETSANIVQTNRRGQVLSCLLMFILSVVPRGEAGRGETTTSIMRARCGCATGACALVSWCGPNQDSPQPRARPFALMEFFFVLASLRYATSRRSSGHAVASCKATRERATTRKRGRAPARPRQINVHTSTPSLTTHHATDIHHIVHAPRTTLPIRRAGRCITRACRAALVQLVLRDAASAALRPREVLVMLPLS